MPSGADLISSVAGTSGFDRVVDLLERLDRWRSHLLPVLTYHRVDDPEGDRTLAPGLISATPEEFDGQMRFLAGSREVVSMADLLDVRRKGKRLAPRSVMVTFDDAYRDFSSHAWPVLRRHGVAVTLFVPTAYPDRPEASFWWDRLHHALRATRRADPLSSPLGDLSIVTERERAVAFKRLKQHCKVIPHGQAMDQLGGIFHQLGVPASQAAVLGWSELRGLSAQGVAMAAHSQTHAMLDRVSAAHLRTEVEGSCADLRSQIGAALPVFAYPSGQYSDEAVAAVARSGCELAFTTDRGCNDLRKPDWLRLRRINVGRRSSLGLIRTQMLPTSARLHSLTRRVSAR